MHENKNVLGGSNPKIHKVPRNEHGSNERGLGKNAIKNNNSFSPFLYHVECYKCGNFGQKEADCQYE